MNDVIAIDGPAGAGKSTIARRVASQLGYTYIDTGAMYRAVALWAIRTGIGADEATRLEQLATAAEIGLDSQQRVFLNGEEITEAIRTPEVSALASRVAAVGGVRTALVLKQRAIAASRGVVMEGRDIGTVVFPAARVKIFLDADPGERVQRRATEQPHVPTEQLATQIAERDARDRGRTESPLLQAPDAVYVDSTGLTLEQVEKKILDIIEVSKGNTPQVE
jgi:cytidylate kinase